MSDSEDEAAFTSADEEVETSHFVASDKKSAAKTSTAFIDNKKLSLKEIDEKETMSINNLNKSKKKKNKRSKSKEEESAEKLSFESSDSVVSTETSSIQIDNMLSSKPDLEEIHITDESDDSNRTSRNNLFCESNSAKEFNEENEKRTDKKEEVKQSQDITCPHPQICDEKFEKVRICFYFNY